VLYPQQASYFTLQQEQRHHSCNFGTEGVGFYGVNQHLKIMNPLLIFFNLVGFYNVKWDTVNTVNSHMEVSEEIFSEGRTLNEDRKRGNDTISRKRNKRRYQDY